MINEEMGMAPAEPGDVRAYAGGSALGLDAAALEARMAAMDAMWAVADVEPEPEQEPEATEEDHGGGEGRPEGYLAPVFLPMALPETTAPEERPKKGKASGQGGDAPPPPKSPGSGPDKGPGPDDDGILLDADQPAIVLARVIGTRMQELLAAGETPELFRRDGSVVARTMFGRFEPMDPVWFSTWLFRHGFTVRKTVDKKWKVADLPEALGARILRSTELLELLPPLNSVNKVRLPVLRTELDERGQRERKGFRKIELLPIGYDRESGIWTESQCDYATDWTYEDAREWFDDLYRYFQWSDEDRLAVQHAAMLTAYCREMYPGRPPMFIWNSNLPGSGKSTLARMILHFVFGRASSKPLDQKNRRDLRLELDTAAMEYAESMWFDDVVGKVAAPELRVWITESNRAGRILSLNKSFDVTVRALTFVTGAQLKLDGHLERRSLVVDLFPTRQLADRVLPKDAKLIEEEWLLDVENRRNFLSALWAMVQHWDFQGRPKGAKLVASLEGWSRIVPGIVASNGWGNCLAPFEQPDSGNLDDQEGRKLIEAIIREYQLVGRVTNVEVIATARLHGLFKHVLRDLDMVVAELEIRRGWKWKLNHDGSEPNMEEKRLQASGWRDESIDKRWSSLWAGLAFNGLEFCVDGYWWQFGRRKADSQRFYEITRVRPSSSAPVLAA